MSITEQYEAARKELLDLGLRNSLLNFRHSSAKGVRVQGESSAEIFRILAQEEKAMTFVPRKGLEVDLSPHLTNARNRLDDLPPLPADAEPEALGKWLKTIAESAERNVQSLRQLPARVDSAIADAANEENEAAGRLLLDEVELAISHAERLLARANRGKGIFKDGVDAHQAKYITKSIEQELEVMSDDHLARVEDAATGGALREQWLKPLTEKELTDTKLQTNDTDRRLQRRLLTTYHAARTYMEERGHNVLFLALGMLHWREEADPKRDLKAPLLLVPVKLERAAVRERYKLSYTGDDIEENLSLAEKLRQEHAIELPEFVRQIEDIDPKAYLEAVAKKVEHKANWEVDADEIYLGFFSFTKLLMYRDLDCKCWPEDEQPVEHALIKAVLADGFNEPGSEYDDETMLDDLHAPTDSFEVMDADGSQLTTILDVRDGRNLVIQGPPGTGKSQTITNLIAQALGMGQRVLFVAEKMAALEVVKRRMDIVGLGDACLEVHSHNANKKSIIAELKRTLNQGRVVETENAASDLELLGRLRGKLNEYATAVNAPLAQTGYSAYEIFGELIHQQRKLKDATDLPRPVSMLESLSQVGTVLQCTRAGLEERTVLVKRLQEHLVTLGPPGEHPFRGAGLTMMMPSERDQLGADLPAALEALREEIRKVAALRERLGFGAQANRNDAKRLAATSAKAASAPDLRGMKVRSRAWEDEEVALVELAETGGKYCALHSENDERLIPEAWGRDVVMPRAALMEHGEKWYKFLIGDFRKAKSEIRALCRGGQAPSESTELIRICETIMDEKRLGQVIEANVELGGEVYGKQWRGVKSDWDKLSTAGEYIMNLWAAVRAGEVDVKLLEFVETNPDTLELPALAAAMKAAAEAARAKLDNVFDLLKWPAEAREEFFAQDFDGQVSQLEGMIGNTERLDEQIFFNQLAEELLQCNLDWVLDGAGNWTEANAYLVNWFRNAWFERMLHVLLDEREPLRLFNHASHAEDIGRFRELDELLFLFNRIKLAAQHWKGLPSMVGNGQLGILMREFEKRVRHLPIRRLMTDAGRAMQAIKPVFMMSPMSVASFLPPGAMEFDLVIFDEASQVKPVDALGAILRGKQLVVVGDSKQMPPTRFFDTIGGDDGDDEGNRLADLESILGTMTGQRAPQRMLRWHYRSRHESLIAVSNQEFYDGKLVIFPNSNPADPDLGIKYHHLPDTVYERGATSSNPLEARAVAEAVFRHARECPQLTLGVAAFSVKQMQAVYDEVERMRMADNSCEEFFGSHEHEPFFVKNLENVQGDERDVIFISVGYGKDEDRKVSMNFGPLNAEGGERRLNVLITRARRRSEVFTNLRAFDIDLNRTDARGVAVFKAYLQYAETGTLEEETDSGAAVAGVSTIFEEEVAAFLREQGHEVAMKVGEAGFFIDLAVANPNKAGAYLLGIECDGPEYNRARTARDRDRLRGQVLRGLGWNVYRLWSVEWFAHPQQEKERLLAALQAAVEGRPIVKDVTTGEADQLRAKRLEQLKTIRREPTSAKLTGTLSQPEYKIAKPRINLGKKDLIDQPEEKLAKWVTEIVQVESPINHDEAYDRFLGAAGKRTGSRNQEAFTKGLGKAKEDGLVRIENDFLFDTEQPVVTVRDRRRLPASDRKLELVADAEVDEAILISVRQSFGINPDDIPVAATRLMGFDRTLEPMRERVVSRVDSLMAAGKLTRRNGQMQATH